MTDQMTADRPVREYSYTGGELLLGNRTLVMGILNVTPDSFSDGGRFNAPEAAAAHALDMERAGADIIDIGGESSRPGSDPVSSDDELSRVLPVLEILAERGPGVPISIDTRKPEVAGRAVKEGACIINDISGFRDPAMIETAARTGAAVIIMHMLGEPGTMQDEIRYDNVVDDIKAYLARSAETVIAGGVSAQSVMIDPGIGFGKTVDHNLEILRRIDEFASLGFPVLVGASRKSFIGKSLGLEIEKRLPADIAVTSLLAQKGVDVVRVHDVYEHSIACRMIEAVINGSEKE